ncbi:hypothetical protein ACJZ2D_000273 [Fusarium nematophilum]
MWRRGLPQALLWSRYTPPTEGGVFRSQESKAPSWSWISANGPFVISGTSCHHGGQICCSVEQVCLHPVDKKHNTGSLSGGALKVHGHFVGPMALGADRSLTKDSILDAYVGHSGRRKWKHAGNDNNEFALDQWVHRGPTPCSRAWRILDIEG